MTQVKDKVICPICQKEQKHKGALNLHLRQCKLKQYEAEEQGKEKPNNECENGGEHELQYLNKRDPQQAFILSHGYNKICTKCTGVFE